MSRNTNPQVSACIVIRNEEAVLDRCLRSLEGIVHEIIVVHDGPCRDRSLEIAASYGARVITEAFVGCMEPHLVRAYAEARGEWLLRIDADEFFSAELRQKFSSLLENTQAAAFSFIWPLYDGEKYRTKQWPHKICLFRKSAIAFLGVTHQNTEINGKVIKTSYLLEHHPGYNNYSWKSFREKWLRWAKLQAQAVLGDINAIPQFQYMGRQWPRRVLWRRRCPLGMLPFDGIVPIMRMLCEGAYKEGPFAWRVAFLMGLYRAAVDWYIFLYKNKVYSRYE